ncbi:glutaminyl-peptide cyclotransferase-like protein [Biomphalaria glabrata]
MTSLGWHVEEDQFRDLTPYGEIPFSNVIATLDPAVTKRIVLACHYDSKLLPGFVAASDSAAPCSVMIETARWLGSMVSEAYSQGTIDFTLQLLFFDGEEAFIRWSDDDSLYGSRHLAELWERTPDRNYPSVNSLKNIVSIKLQYIQLYSLFKVHNS